MSVEARSWARKVVVGNPTAKAVLCAIADYADSNGIAWPSQTSLAEDTEFSERAVRNAIQLLELKGLLATQKRHRKDGSRKADLLTLAIGQQSNRHEVPVGDIQPAPGAGSPTGTSFQTNRHGVPNQPAPAAGLTSFEPSLNRQQNSSEATASGIPEEPDVPFSPKDLLWRDGVLTLQGLGLADNTARRFIGKLMRQTGGDAGRVHWAIDEAQRAETGDPIPYVTRLLNDAPTNARAGPARFEGRDSAATILLKRDAEARRHEQSADQHDFLDISAGSGGPEPRNRSPRDPYAQRDRVGGTGQILDLVAVGSSQDNAEQAKNILDLASLVERQPADDGVRDAEL